MAKNPFAKQKNAPPAADAAMQEPPPPAVEPSLPPPQASGSVAAVRAFDLAFRRQVPQGALGSGVYAAKSGDRFAGQANNIADGTYRVAGSDWLLTFKAGAFVEAALAKPPEFGGADVIAV
jgi:hypothetical protein